MDLLNRSNQYRTSSNAAKQASTALNMNTDTTNPFKDTNTESMDIPIVTTKSDQISMKTVLYQANPNFGSGAQFIESEFNKDNYITLDKHHSTLNEKRHYGRTILPSNGKVIYTDAVTNQVEAEEALKERITRYRGRAITSTPATRIHPNAAEAGATNNPSLWAYNRGDYFNGINAHAEMTSNLEYMPQKQQMEALREIKNTTDATSVVLDKLYNAQPPISKYGDIQGFLHAEDTQNENIANRSALDSQNRVPIDTISPFFFDGTRSQADINKQYRAAERANQIEASKIYGYTPPPEQWWSK